MVTFDQKKFLRKLKKMTGVEMEYFRNPIWQLVTLLETFSGTWPYQRKLQQYLLQTLHFVIAWTFTATVINKSREYIGVDFEMMIECGLALMYFIGISSKLTLSSALKSKRRAIYDKTNEHFKTITDPIEAKVLREFAEKGFKFTAIYMFTVFNLSGLFGSIPNVRLLYRYLFYHEDFKLILTIPMDYGFDHEKYWYIVGTHFIIFFFTGFVLFVGFDLSFILQIHHAQALLKIVRMRLQKASELARDLKNGSDDGEMYSMISTAVQLHSECFEIIGMIEDTYSVSLAFIILMNSTLFGASIHIISVKLDDPLETVRNICAFSMFSLHFYVIFAQGQSITDSSSTIPEACYECYWYNMPNKSRKLLYTMMIRSSEPCELTGAQIFPLSIETFGNMYKGGLSYYTLFEQ